MPKNFFKQINESKHLKIQIRSEEWHEIEKMISINGNFLMGRDAL
jgi:hypothetical protein